MSSISMKPCEVRYFFNRFMPILFSAKIQLCLQSTWNPGKPFLLFQKTMNICNMSIQIASAHTFHGVFSPLLMDTGPPYIWGKPWFPVKIFPKNQSNGTFKRKKASSIPHRLLTSLSWFFHGFLWFSHVFAHHPWWKFHEPRRAWDRVAPPLPSNESARPFLPSCLAGRGALVAGITIGITIWPGGITTQ